MWLDLLQLHFLITHSSHCFICSSSYRAFNDKMPASSTTTDACNSQRDRFCSFYRFAHNRHSPLPPERQMVAEGGSSGKSTPSWPRVEDGSDRPPSGRCTLHQSSIIKEKRVNGICIEVMTEGDQWRSATWMNEWAKRDCKLNEWLKRRN